jgi:hypothetical protein
LDTGKVEYKHIKKLEVHFLKMIFKKIMKFLKFTLFHNVLYGGDLQDISLSNKKKTVFGQFRYAESRYVDKTN